MLIKFLPLCFFCVFRPAIFLKRFVLGSLGERESFSSRKKVGLEHTCLWTLEYFIYTLKITIEFSVVVIIVVEGAQIVFNHVSSLVCVFSAFDVVCRASVSALVFLQTNKTPTLKIKRKGYAKEYASEVCPLDELTGDGSIPTKLFNCRNKRMVSCVNPNIFR